ncbi:MAG TPA: purine-nucleoside phosphorylase [Chloroflexota bacterium]|nr:purine-nucleoside phosphorylase [Chloroflexota bacterium]
MKELLAEAAAAVETRTALRPAIGLILGSGLGGLADRVAVATVVPYGDIPGFPLSRVEGHANRLLLGTLAGMPVAALQGRAHLYEGYSPQEVVFPTRVLAQLGVRTLIVSNAAGGLNLSFRPGDLMLIADHIFLPGIAGLNPLAGPNDDRLGPRFPNMTDAYDAELRAIARQAGPDIREGVYVMAAGPSYETPAEVRWLRSLGADAVGMSTCPEVVAARHMGMRVLGISLISNVLTGEPVSHEEVLATADAAAQRFCGLVERIVERLGAE